MPERKRGPKLPVIEMVVDDDLDGLTQRRIVKEQQMFEDRAERVRNRLTMNQAFLPQSSRGQQKGRKKKKATG